MPTITSIQLLRHRGNAEPVGLGAAHDVSSFGYFERKAVREMLAFVGRTVAKRTLEGQRQSVEHEAYICHCYNRGGLIGLTFVGKDYPSRAAFSVVNKVMDEFTDSKGDAWKAVTADTTDGDEIVNAALQKYQDPHEADKLLKIQRELDETKVILHKTIDSVLQRGEKLDSLVDKSNDLSLASQVFYKAAKKNNQCCKMM
eukprot:PRCOL_00000446-RA